MRFFRKKWVFRDRDYLKTSASYEETSNETFEPLWATVLENNIFEYHVEPSVAKNNTFQRKKLNFFSIWWFKTLRLRKGGVEEFKAGERDQNKNIWRGILNLDRHKIFT